MSLFSTKNKACSLFKLTAANDGQLPVILYIKLDMYLLGLKVLKVGFPITKDPDLILDNKHQTKLPGVVGWNMIWLVYEEFVRKYPSVFDMFLCSE